MGIKIGSDPAGYYDSVGSRASSADQGWYLKTLPPFITNAIWRSAVASAR